jgi:hypothetical protein
MINLRLWPQFSNRNDEQDGQDGHATITDTRGIAISFNGILRHPVVFSIAKNVQQENTLFSGTTSTTLLP